MFEILEHLPRSIRMSFAKLHQVDLETGVALNDLKQLLIDE